MPCVRIVRMNLGTTTLAILTAYQFPAIFFGVSVFSETIIIPGSFIAGQGIWAVDSVFWIAYLGTVISDMAWFFVGPSIFRFAHRFERITKRSEAVMKRLDTLYAGRPFRVLLMSKFIYGTRILTIIYLSLEKISAVKFLVSNLLGTFVWLSAVVAVGWLAGRSIINLMPMLSDVKYAILIIVILVVGFEFIPKWLQKKKVEKELVSPHE